MLKQIMLWMAVCVSSLLSAQETVTLECRVAENIKMDAEGKVTLYEVKKGRLVEFATGNYSEGGYFAFQFIPAYEGFYMVGNEKNYCYPVWIKKKGRVSVLIDREGGHLYGKKNSEENKVLYRWVDLSGKVSDMAVGGFKYRNQTFQDFFQELEKLIPLADQFKVGIKTGNPYFNQLMNRLVDYQKDYFAVTYLSRPKPVDYIWPEKSDYSAYYQTILSSDKFQDNLVLKMPEGFRMLDSYVNFTVKMKNDRKSGWEPDLSLISCQELKGEFLLAQLERIPSTFQFRKILNKNREVFTEDQLRQAESLLKKLEEKSARQQAVDFTFPDANGKMVSLSDFKGKIVLVDIWATWCMPCRSELPHLKKLEEEMEGTDLVVIGISVDVQKDYNKWKKMVDAGEVKGVQLFADGGKQLRKDYGVSGIPRFIVFDREGKVFEATAPRPSGPDLKELLNELLKK